MLQPASEISARYQARAEAPRYGEIVANVYETDRYQYTLLDGEATLCAVAASAGEPLVDFRAIGKTV